MKAEPMNTTMTVETMTNYTHELTLVAIDALRDAMSVSAARTAFKMFADDVPVQHRLHIWWAVDEPEYDH